MSIDLKQAGSTGSNGRIKAMVNKLRENKSDRLSDKVEKKEGKATSAGLDYDKTMLESDASYKKDRKKENKAYRKMENKKIKKEKVEDKKAKVDKKISKYKES